MNEENDRLWDQIPKSDPELLARQLSALSHWLRLTSWTEHEAACLIAGVLPPERTGDTRSFGAWLPGREVSDPIREAWRMVVKSDIEHIEKLLKEAKTEHDQSPRALLDLGMNRGHTPPWLPVAAVNQECRKYLPLSALNEELASAKVPKTQREIASLGGQANRDRNPKRIKFFPVVESLLKSGHTPAEVVAILQESDGDDAPSQSTIYNWAKVIAGSAKPST